MWHLQSMGRRPHLLLGRDRVEGLTPVRLAAELGGASCPRIDEPYRVGDTGDKSESADAESCGEVLGEREQISAAQRRHLHHPHVLDVARAALGVRRDERGRILGATRRHRDESRGEALCVCASHEVEIEPTLHTLHLHHPVLLGSSTQQLVLDGEQCARMLGPLP